ncbi:MAG: helix-turn-helix transcriptional regulator [Actinomycetes bacterium]|jgi:proteasome accessory factor C|nr:WYL domain-containing protein [Candidatus Nanopelagicales bacterium]MDP4824951.1 WYL domain-containing protein [Candidatus Nanopelagicales bacterium]MDP4887697.1 WYL domain-containing protein [Candidatus Nanopelagicales bacterium]
MSQDATSRLGRLLALVPWLSAHPGVSIAEAAEHFGITTAQLQDDLWLLVLSGLPGHGPGDLIDIQFWDTGDPASNDADTDDVAAVLADSHIFVVDPQTLTHAVRLTPQESVGLLLGLRQLATVPGDHDPGVLHDTIAALEQLMAADGLGEAHVVVESDTSPDILAAINAAVEGDCGLEIQYLAASTDQVSRRVIDIHRTVVADGYTYLQAWCHQSAGLRSFRLDRIAWAQPRPDVTVVTRTKTEPEESPQPMIATVLVDAQARWLIDSYRLDAAGQEPDGRTRVKWPIWQPSWLIRLALDLGGELEIVEPVIWRQEVITQARRALA